MGADGAEGRVCEGGVFGEGEEAEVRAGGLDDGADACVGDCWADVGDVEGFEVGAEGDCGHGCVCEGCAAADEEFAELGVC